MFKGKHHIFCDTQSYYCNVLHVFTVRLWKWVHSFILIILVHHPSIRYLYFLFKQALNIFL